MSTGWCDPGLGNCRGAEQLTEERVVPFRDQFTGRGIAFAAALSLAPFFLIAWAVRDVQRLVPQVREHSIAVYQLTGRIDYLDEALTSSALLAASSGDPRWEARYDELEADLVERLGALRVGSRMLNRPEIADSVTAVADTLSALEHRAMELAREGDREGALALLVSPAYDDAKQRYQEQRSVLLGALENWTATEEERADERLSVIMALVAATFLLLVSSWIVSTHLVRRHINIRRRTERDLMGRVFEQERLEAELRAAEERLRAIMDVAPVAIVRVDRERRVEYWNPAAERIFGWSAEEVTGRPYPLATLDEEDDSIELFRRAFGGEIMDGLDLVRRTKHGSAVEVQMWNAPVRSEGGEIGALVGVFADVTEQRSLERRLRQAGRMEAIGRLAGGIAHDFNNVMTAVQGHADLLLEALSSSDPARHDIEEIRRNAGRATDLTRQLLAFSRRQVLQPRVLALGSVVRTLEPMLNRVLGEHIELETREEEGTGHVEADPTQLEQVVVNLAVNARDAMPDGGRLRIEIEAARLTEEDAAEFEYDVLPGEYVRLLAADTGKGMDESTRQQVFEPFFTTKPSGSGTGLGLATVYGIVKQSGGYVWVDSEPARGTTFEILLPRVDKPLPPPEALEAEANGRDSPALTGHERVLLVEDDDAVRHLAGRVLNRYGYTLISAATPLEALARIDAGDVTDLDLLVTDMVLPEMGGQELARRVAERFPNVRTLFMSGYTEDEVLKRDVARGTSVFLAKPFGPGELARTVRSILDPP